jgi:hypothetical protein
MLLKANPEGANAIGYHNKGMLQRAVEEKDIDVVKLLLKYGGKKCMNRCTSQKSGGVNVDINEKGKVSLHNTPVLAAIKNKDEEMMLLLMLYRDEDFFDDTFESIYSCNLGDVTSNTSDYQFLEDAQRAACGLNGQVYFKNVSDVQ